jgi:hypothetical protein
MSTKTWLKPFQSGEMREVDGKDGSQSVPFENEMIVLKMRGKLNHQEGDISFPLEGP